MIKMTFSDYDRLVEVFKDVELKTFWPTPEQVKVMEAEPERRMAFACYLNEQEEPPRTQEEMLGKSKLRDFINHNLELIDDEETEEEVITRQDYEEIKRRLASY